MTPAISMTVTSNYEPTTQARDTGGIVETDRRDQQLREQRDESLERVRGGEEHQKYSNELNLSANSASVGVVEFLAEVKCSDQSRYAGRGSRARLQEEVVQLRLRFSFAADNESPQAP